MIPLFKSHYSVGKSILTLRPKGDSKSNESDSIIDIAVDNGLSEVYLVEDNMSGFLEAYTNLSNENIKLNFGLRLIVCNDLEDKSAESISTESKIIVFAPTQRSYEALIKINDKASKDGFYYQPRIDYKSLRAAYEECRDLIFCIPFYDSFIHANVIQNRKCVPEFGNINPVFMLEDNDLPFDDIIAERVLEYNLNDQPKDIIRVKTCYYKNREDFDAYMTFRCISKRTSLEKPNFEHMCSDEFCFESWKDSVNE
jgi:DNA polymerase-3 subunit alpha